MSFLVLSGSGRPSSTSCHRLNDLIWKPGDAPEGQRIALLSWGSQSSRGRRELTDNASHFVIDMDISRHFDRQDLLNHP